MSQHPQSSKPIQFSKHAREQMLLRGATEEEVTQTIREEKWMPAKRDKHQAKRRFHFGKLSPVNRKEYRYKEIEPIFVEESDAVVVVTIKVYYTNEEETR